MPPVNHPNDSSPVLKSLQIRLLGSLNDFLPAQQREQTVEICFQGDQSYKHLIESLGVPHPEIASIRVDGASSEIDRIAQDGCVVEVYPYRPGDRSIRPSLIRFVLDGHLGKLASYLRILGFDVRYANSANDETLAIFSANEDRILLTRDRGLLKRNLVRYGYWIRDQNPRQQLLEVILRYDLAPTIHPFTRCPKCNGLLSPVEKEAVAERLLPSTLENYDCFWRCAACQQVYWQGSHYQRIQSWLRALLANS